MRTVDMPGVVDTMMRVQGIMGLRVADTSVMLFPLAEHAQALAFAIGESVSRMLFALIIIMHLSYFFFQAAQLIRELHK